MERTRETQLGPESLEARQMMAAHITATLTKGVLTITGASGNDKITVHESNGIAGTYISIDDVKINVGGTMKGSIADSQVTRIVIDGGAGNDTINLAYTDYDQVSIGATIRGGKGNDHIEGGSGKDSIFGDAGEDWIYGNGGNDTINGGTERDDIFGGKGNDTINGEAGNDSIHGDSGNDTISGGIGDDNLWGGTDNDTMWGNVGLDRLYGQDGNDKLGGGSAKMDATKAGEKDELVGGRGFNRYSDDFDLKKWVIDGTKLTDIRQQQSPTCVTLSTLSAAAKAGYKFTITYDNGTTYTVKLFDTKGKAVYEKVTFDGTWNDNDPAPSVDAGNRCNPEFWTILMQRARLEHFFMFDSTKEMSKEKWDAEILKNKDICDFKKATQQLLGWKSEQMDIFYDTKADKLIAALKRGDIVTCATEQTIDIQNLAPNHAYTVVDIYRDSHGTLMIKLYNPWGVDNKKSEDGADDGYVTMAWEDFVWEIDMVSISTAKA